ncbi:Protein of unknown function [Gryllus bimaculatus]|nr:Protein of unknown function [Gryllus bimaculatus]
MHCALAVFTSMVLVLLLALATCAQPIGDWPESGSKRQVTGVIPDLCHPPFKMIRKRCRLVSRKRAAGRLQQLQSVGSLRQNRDNAMFGDEVDY